MAQEELQESKLTKAGGRKPTHGCNYPMVGWPSVILTPMGPSLNLTREGTSRPSLRSSLSLSVNNVNIVAVHSKYWSTYGKTQVDITYLRKTARFVVLDLCADTDCDGCCTANLNWNRNGFLLDVDSTAARRVWGISNAENTLKASATYKPVANSKVDFAALKAKYP